MRREPRRSISAEVYGRWNKKGMFVAPFYEKSQETKARILKKLESCFMFTALSHKDKTVVISAMQEVCF